MLPVLAHESEDSPFTVGDLLDEHALGVRPVESARRWLDVHETGERIGPFHVTLWLGDEARRAYDDASLGIDDAIRGRPGVELVE